ncbi:PdxA family protein [Rhizobium sp. P32RR-XVIII]|uniref:PdxA family dehydrogenase n=1 Tax=Rhizobium sp. P32RR-XVIII TaxID=2726738 RepID=UPI003918492A
MVKLALSGVADAICAGQSSKDALDSARLRAHRNVRVGRITRHIAQEDVPKHVKPKFSRVVALTDGALHILGLERPKIAIAALNPHAGEGGLFGRQDIDVVEPAISALREDGFDVEGPVGDMVFVKLRARQFDAVVAMHHDQGHIPVKLLGSSVDEKTGRMEALSSVNATLGLPIIRTSVDHGTAFDIAGKGIASETSLIEAIELAVTMSRA